MPKWFLFYFLERYKSLTNSNMSKYDFSISNSIHYVIELLQGIIKFSWV